MNQSPSSRLFRPQEQGKSLFLRPPREEDRGEQALQRQTVPSTIHHQHISPMITAAIANTPENRNAASIFTTMSVPILILTVQWCQFSGRRWWWRWDAKGLEVWCFRRCRIHGRWIFSLRSRHTCKFVPRSIRGTCAFWGETWINSFSRSNSAQIRN